MVFILFKLLKFESTVYTQQTRYLLDLKDKFLVQYLALNAKAQAAASSEEKLCSFTSVSHSINFPVHLSISISRALLT